MKKALSIISFIAGGLVLLSVVAPRMIGALLKTQTAANSISMIGGTDGPTVIMLVGTVGGGSVIIEIIIGVLLMVAGIWGLRKIKK